MPTVVVNALNWQSLETWQNRQNFLAMHGDHEVSVVDSLHVAQSGPADRKTGLKPKRAGWDLRRVLSTPAAGDGPMPPFVFDAHADEASTLGQDDP